MHLINEDGVCSKHDYGWIIHDLFGFDYLFQNLFYLKLFSDYCDIFYYLGSIVYLSCCLWYYSVPHPFVKGEPKYWKFKKEGNLERYLMQVRPNRNSIFRKRGGSKLFKLNLGIEKDKNGDSAWISLQICLQYHKLWSLWKNIIHATLKW